MPEMPPINLEQKETKQEYDPIAVLRERELYDGILSKDENGQDKIEDEDLRQIFKFLRENVKEGSLLNMGAGIMHCHHLAGLADKLTQITALDISPKNNELIKEFLESMDGKVGQMVQESDIQTLKDLTSALCHDKETYGIEKTSAEMLADLKQKSFYKGQPDIITADMVLDMDKLGSGELVDGRKYDNIMFTFALYVEDKEGINKLFSNLKQRLNLGGRIVIVDAKNFEIEEEDGKGELYSEDKIVLEKYSDAYDWQIEDIQAATQKAGFSKVEGKEYQIQAVEEEQEGFGGYLFLKVEA